MASAPGLEWLPAPRSDWRARVGELASGDASDPQSWADAKALARTRLNFTATNTLDAACRGLRPREVRLAIFSSSTTAHLTAGLRVAAVRRGFALDVFEPDYGQYRQELADPSSRTHSFAPTHVLFAFDADHVAAQASGVASSAAAVARILEDWVELWRNARALGAVVLQQTIMPRLPASGGSNEQRLPESGAAFLARLNAELRDVAETEGIDLVALDAQITLHGLDAWFSPASWYGAKQEVSLPAAPYYGDLVVRVIAARLGRSGKCCVFDLDNTLWGGVVGDDGVEGLMLGHGSAAGEAFLDVHRYALTLKARGVILAVNSKNDEAVAVQAFEKHPDTLLKRSDFTAFLANWHDKASNLRTIARTLNLGLDSFVFVDDNPFEREQVRAALPDVFVPELPDDPALVPRRLVEAGCFELVVLTQEDLARTAAYAANRERDEARSAAGDLDSYLHGLGMVLEHAPVSTVEIPRVTQLINKTNQFNLTTRRLSESEVRAIASDTGMLLLSLRLRDRFGDNGIIAVVGGRLDGSTFCIEDWLMSCRVIGRDVEYATLTALIEQLCPFDVTSIKAVYRPSGRNGMVADLLQKLGFGTRTDEAGTVYGELDLGRFTPRPSPVSLRKR